MLPADKALMERLGARLREIRELAKLSQESVGEKAGFSGKYIGEIEKGVRDVPISTLRAVVEAGLGMRLEAFFSEQARRKRAPEASLARDVEITASMLAGLPMKMRRPLLALVTAVNQREQATRAAERSAPQWQPGKHRRARR